MRPKSICAIAMIAAMASVPAGAQSIFGEIRGTVTDPSGAVITGATVTVTNTGTNETRKVTTDAVGNYAVVNIEAGTYDVGIEHSGFRKALVQNVLLRAREIARVDASLEVGGAVTEVLVSAASQVVTTDQATIVDSKTAEQILAMPTNFRGGGTNTVFSVISFTPGVQPDSGGGSLSLAGSMPFMANATVDGISTINVRSNGILTEMFPSADSIDEIKVSMVSNNAEFSQVGDVTTTSKAGTNTYHGSLFWYHQNGAMDARDTFSTRSAPFKISNDFGGSIGGPVIHNKTFFYGTFEGLRYRAQNQINIIVPPDSFRGGNLSSVSGAITDPTNNNQPFTGNIIPAARINPVSAKILERLYPHQNQPGDQISSPNFRIQKSAGNRNDQFDVRGDHVFNERHSIFSRVSWKDITRRSPASLVTFGDDRTPEKDLTLVGAHNFIIRPNLMNEFRTGYSNRDRVVDFGPDGTSFDGPALVKELGIQGIRPDPPQGASTPDFGITGFQGTGKSRGFTQNSRTLQFANNITWTKGRHAFKFGADIRYLRTTDNVSFFSGDDLGEYRFQGRYTGNAFADFLLGFPQRTRLANTGPDIDSYVWHQGYFAQDDFKITSKLTLNYGVRYEYHPPFWDRTLQLANFERDYPGGRVIVPNEKSLGLTAPGFRASIGNTPIVTAKEAGIPDTLRYADKNNFAPRIGFAWRPFGNRTVFRGGYGIYTVTILGSVLYSLVGIHTSDTRTFDNTVVGGVPQLRFLTPFGAGLGTIGAVGTADFRRGNGFRSPDPYIQQWNFTIERDLGWNTGLRLTYTGSLSLKLFSSPDLNQVRPNTVGYATAKLSRPYPNWNIVYSRDTGPAAKYESAIVEISHRFARGLQFQSSWIWAKGLTNALGSDSTNFAAENGSVPTDRFNLGIDYGNTGGVRRQRWLTAWVYEIPYGRGGRNLGSGAERVLKLVAGGWQLSGILLVQTGQLFTPITGGSTDPSGTNVDSRANDRPDYAGASNGNLDGSERSIRRWWDRTAFVIPRSNIGRFGLVGPGLMIGPGTTVLSTKLQKRFYVREGRYLQLEGSAQNLPNHPNYAAPARNISSSSFGVISSTQGAEGAGSRTMQIGLRMVF